MKALMTTLIVLITVSVAFAGNVTLSWDASPSQGVTGYKLYYGNTAENLEYTQDIGNALTTEVTALASGDWFFGVTAYSPDQESALSNIVSTTIEPFTPTENLHIPVTKPASITIQIDVAQ